MSEATSAFWLPRMSLRSCGLPAEPQLSARIFQAALSAEKYLESVGFHLVGLPEIHVAKSYGSERQAVAVMDSIADDMAK